MEARRSVIARPSRSGGIRFTNERLDLFENFDPHPNRCALEALALPLGIEPSAAVGLLRNGPLQRRPLANGRFLQFAALRVNHEPPLSVRTPAFERWHRLALATVGIDVNPPYGSLQALSAIARRAYQPGQKQAYSQAGLVQRQRHLKGSIMAGNVAPHG